VFFVCWTIGLYVVYSLVFLSALYQVIFVLFFCARGTRYKFSEASSIVHLSSKCAGELIFEKFSREFLPAGTDCEVGAVHS
jgi:hypothetical protein